MKKDKRKLLQYQNILVPVFPGAEKGAIQDFAVQFEGHFHFVGFLDLPESKSVSSAAGDASVFRENIRKVYSGLKSQPQITIKMTENPLEDLWKLVAEEQPDLLVLEWPLHFDLLKVLPVDILKSPKCDVAVLRGPWPKSISRILLPLRGGPFAEMALRLARHLPHEELYVVNFSREPASAVEAPFRGLVRILPNLEDVTYHRAVSPDPREGILSAAKDADLIVMGTSGQSAFSRGAIGTVFEYIFQNADIPVIAVRTREEEDLTWKDNLDELSGVKAISLLVDRWFAENTYRGREFENLSYLLELKENQNLSISLALPALNEEKTVGKVIETIKTALMDKGPLLDEIVLIDSRSTDRTREIAESLGVPVYIHQELLKDYGERRGKGEALWKSLYVTSGDILLWIDTDIVNIHPRFVYGVIGPLLSDPRVQFVKGFYKRPLKVGDKVQAGGGGRVTELTARPMLNLFYPELSGVIQPLSGEYGGRRQALEQMHFFSGYGVEIGLLTEMFEKFGLSSIAQVDLLERIHHNQPLEALSKMSFVILQALMRRLEGRFDTHLLEDVNRSIKLVRYDRKGYYLDVEEMSEFERPPMLSIPAYREKFYPENEE